MIYLLELLNAGRDVKTRDSREYVVCMQCTYRRCLFRSAIAGALAQGGGSGAELRRRQVHLERLRRGWQLPQAQEAQQREALPLLLWERRGNELMIERIEPL